MRLNSDGQTLLEVIIVATVAILIIGAFAFATISSLRNADFAKNQAQATKLAQEGIEKVRSIRDRGDPITGGFTIDSFAIDSWKDDDLWRQISHTCLAPINCYFKLSGANLQFIGTGNDVPTSAEPLGDNKFKRAIILSDDPVSYQDRKNVVVIVRWTDFSGDHQSQLTTILRRL